MKIIFLGTPKFGAIILERLAKTEFKPILVITEPDKPAGRSQDLRVPECKIIAEKYAIALKQPDRIKNLASDILKLECDLIIVAAYGQIIPKEILEIPKYGCLNVHPSLLPKYRGSSPIQYAILNQEKETGTTIMLMDEEIDHGDIIASSRFSVSEKIYYNELEKNLAEIGADLLIKTIPDWINKKLKATPQNSSDITFTKIIKKEDGEINWNATADEIDAKIRAFEIWPGAFSFWDKKRVKILEADVKPLQNIKNYDIGRVVEFAKGEVAVGCKSNFLVIKKLQLEGKRVMSTDDFLKGNSKFIGSILK